MHTHTEVFISKTTYKCDCNLVLLQTGAGLNSQFQISAVQLPLYGMTTSYLMLIIGTQ